MEADGQDDERGVLHFFMDGTRLITVRTRALRSTDMLRRQIEEGVPAYVFCAGPAGRPAAVPARRLPEEAQP